MAPALMPVTPATADSRSRQHGLHEQRLLQSSPGLEARSRREAHATRRAQAQSNAILVADKPTGLLALLGMLAHAMSQLLAVRDFKGDAKAEGAILKTALIGSLLSAIVILLLLAKMAPKLFESNAAVVSTVNNESITTGDADADSIKPVFGFFLAVTFLLGFLGLALGASKLGKSG